MVCGTHLLLPRKMQQRATWKSAKAAPMPLGTYRKGCALATPYAVHRQPLTIFMAQIGAYMEAALRVRKTCMQGIRVW